MLLNCVSNPRRYWSKKLCFGIPPTISFKTDGRMSTMSVNAGLVNPLELLKD